MLSFSLTRRLPTLGLGLLTWLGGACQRPAASAGCIDPTNINPSGICTADYAPVCGCDGQTYSNACQAGRAGVRAYQPGACPGK